MTVCEACGTENRDKARFCIGCARPIGASFAETQIDSRMLDDAAKPRRRKMRCPECRAVIASGDPVCKACGHPMPQRSEALDAAQEATRSNHPGSRMWLWLGGLLFAAVAIGGWWIGANRAPDPTATPPPGALAPNPAPGNERQPPPTMNQGAQPPPVPAAEMAKNPADQVHLDEVVKREAERAARAQSDRDRLAEQERKNRAAKAALARQRAEKVAQAAASTQNTAAPPVQASPPLQTPPVSPAPTAPVKPSVEQACAKTTNFLARDLCRIDACRKPDNARDPICIWFRQLEEERQRQLER